MEDPKPKQTAADKEACRELAIRKVLDGRTKADVAYPVMVGLLLRYLGRRIVLGG